MADAVLVQPDTSFIKDVMASGGGDLKKCFQCGACTAVCALAADGQAFPRRQMIAAQWGQKDRLVGDPAIWLCYDCGDCTAQCPRGARPSDVCGAIRRTAIKHFAFPAFLGSLVANPKALVLLFVLPALIFAAIAFWAPRGAATTEAEFANVFPVPVLEALFFAVSGFVLLAFVVGMARFAKALRAGGSAGLVAAALVAALVEIATHRRFAQCGAERQRRLGHLLTLYGFVGLAMMGTVVGMGTMLGVMRTPLALTNPLKLFANACAAVILAGVVLLLAERLMDPAKRAASTYFDWFFLAVLAAVVITGIVSELLRLAQAAVAMYVVYFVHLVLIFALFLYAPYSKFAHLAYRTVAMAIVPPASRRQGARTDLSSKQENSYGR
jgi:quinone-modifying oxidoreductase subunit QmoC